MSHWLPPFPPKDIGFSNPFVMALDFFAGCVGGIAGVLVGHPLDTVKVKLQTQDFRNPIYRGTWHCFSSILKVEGVRGLYRGVTSPLGGVALVNAIVFGVYGNTLRALGIGEHQLAAYGFAGATAGLVQSLIACPVELAKTRLQLQTTTLYTSSIDCLKKAWKDRGFRGPMRGLGITVAREIPGFGIYFFTYEALVGGQDSSTLVMLLAGGTAGTLSWLVAYPIDVIKTRIQADGLEGPPQFRNSFHCLRDSLAKEGYKFLFRGLNSTLVRAFPVNGVTFVVVTWIFRLAEKFEVKFLLPPDPPPPDEPKTKKPENQSLHIAETSLPVNGSDFSLNTIF